MIITRSPLRISFAGGGTDLPAFYRTHGPGVVVSTAINKYVYVTLNKKFDGKVSIRYRKHEIRRTVSALDHALIREALRSYAVKKGIEVVIISEVPAKGSGLGASSAMLCALVLALEKFVGSHMTGSFGHRKYIAEKASQIEIEECKSPIGKQDHYASAIGGLNTIRFNADESVEIVGHQDQDFIRELEGQSMLFFLDIGHSYYDAARKVNIPDRRFAPRILYDQMAQMEEKAKIHEMQRDNALRLSENLEYAVMERFMDHVNENWRLKRTVHDEITNPEIDSLIQKAYASGATAAKVCGAGGGGFLYLVVPPSMQASVRQAFFNLHELKFGFNTRGVECLFAEEDVHALV